MNYYYSSLTPGQTYHLFTQSNGSELLFRENENYLYFLRKLEKYLRPIADIYAYCFLPGQLDLVVKIKAEDEIRKRFHTCHPFERYRSSMVHGFLMKQVSNMLNSYSKGYNSRYDRKGSLFRDYIKRVEMVANDHLKATISHIHEKPVLLGYVDQSEDWNWSSLRELTANAPPVINISSMLESFGGKDEFWRYHANDRAFRATRLLNIQLAS